MAFESLKAEIGLLLETMGNAPHDRYETYIQLKESLKSFASLECRRRTISCGSKQRSTSNSQQNL